MQGYEYAQLHTSGALDPTFVYLGGSLDCPAFQIAAIEYANSPDFTNTEVASRNVYQAIGPALLNEVLSEQEAWDYYNAYAIYDYVNYQQMHNKTVAALLEQPECIDPNTNLSYFDNLRWLANEQQYAQLGNLSAVNNVSDSGSLQSRITYSISTIAGNMLAAKMLAQLQVAVETQGEYYKLSVLVGDYQPFMSFFALTGLPQWNNDFYGMPNFGSAMAFELFSLTNNSMNMSFPSTDELYVRFLFRNGTDEDTTFQAYPLFNRGPSESDMSWNEFEGLMYSILLSDISDWCHQCGAPNLFCAAWNSTDLSASSSDNSSSSSHHGMSAAVAGVIGAIVALVIAGILFCLAILIGGLRLHRKKSHKSDLGGFKGGQKMQSDRDLTVPKGGAVVGATVERADPMSPVAGGHERVGSWELAQAKEAGMQDNGIERRLSFESERADPFRDPIKADERV